MLELGAVNLDAGASFAEKRLGQSFDYTGFARSGGTEEEQISDRAIGRVETGKEHLIDLNDLFDSGILTDDLAAQSSFKVPGIGAPAAGV
jgi:hypothetical protein